MSETTTVALFTGSRSGSDPAYGTAITALGEEVGRRKWRLVCGGGRGLMKVGVDACLNAGGEVHAIAVPGIDEVPEEHGSFDGYMFESAETQSARQLAMIAHAKMVILGPGGVGALLEFFQAVNERRLKDPLALGMPIGVLNTNGLFGTLVLLLDELVDAGFLAREVRRFVVVEANPIRLLEELYAGLTA